jgi:hypothetical protein
MKVLLATEVAAMGVHTPGLNMGISLGKFKSIIFSKQE